MKERFISVAEYISRQKKKNDYLEPLNYWILGGVIDKQKKERKGRKQ